MNSIFQILTLAWTLQGGQYFNNAIDDAGTFTTNDNYFFQTSFEFQVPFSLVKGDRNNFFIGSDNEVQFSKDSGFGFDPWQDAFTFHTGLRFFGVELGYDHQCVHPILNPDGIKAYQYFSGYDKIYAKISGSF